MSDIDKMREEFEAKNGHLTQGLVFGVDSYSSPDESSKYMAELATDRWIGFRQGYQAAAERYQPKWISVKDGLPTKGSRRFGLVVLRYSNGAKSSTRIICANTLREMKNGTRQPTKYEIEPLPHITHWMEL